MSVLRHPLLPVGVVLVVLGFGNWYTGMDKSREYMHTLAAGDHSPPIDDFDDFRELNAHTTATLLSSLQRGGDESSIVHAKLDFYQVVQSGGRMLILLGLFCAAAGVIRSWYRQRLADRDLRAHGI
jgi:hypothetical protein